VSSDVEVDLPALTDAAAGVSGVIDMIERHKVEDIDPPKASFGHERLGAAVIDFCDRWQHGVSCLAKDGREVAGRLIESVNTYSGVEQSVTDTFLNTLADWAENTGGHTYVE
jgi:hypothetical protein